MPDRDTKQGRDIARLLRQAIEEMMKNVNISLPASIIDYDAPSKRATVLPSIRLVMVDSDDTLDPPAIANVPVVHPSGGGFVSHFPLRKGDPVWLMFCQRDLTRFKEAFGMSTPDRGSLLELKDAVAYPGFGGISISPVTTTGLSIQAEDGDPSIIMEQDRIVLKVGRSTITMTDGDILLASPHVGLND